MRPLLLLDVDGVLNPYPPVPPPGYTEHDLFPGLGLVRVNPEHGVWITELAATMGVAWATTWNELANQLLAPLLHLAPLPVVEMPSPPFWPGDKVPRIAASVGDRPVAWIDDQLTAEAYRWAAERAAPTLLVAADPMVGLTRADVDEVLAWAADL